MTKRDFLKKASVIKNGNQYYAVAYQVMCSMSNGAKFGMDLYFDELSARKCAEEFSNACPDDYYYVVARQIF